MLHRALSRPVWRPLALAVLASVTFAVVVSSVPTEQPVRRADAPAVIAHGAPHQPGLEPPSSTGSTTGDPDATTGNPQADRGQDERRDSEPSRGNRRKQQLPRVAGWTGYAFDACRAPSRRKMDRWRVASPFLGVGIYIGGPLRACPQKHLTRGWVRHQVSAGWRLLPIWVGPQASCTSYRKTITPHPGRRGRFPGARSQGARAAHGAVAAARDLGIRPGATLWYDLEWFPAWKDRCRRSALRLLSTWTRELHQAGYRSGVYSSVSAGIKALGRVRGSGRLHAPDRIWFAWENGRRDSWLGRKWLRAPRWKHRDRVHQYALDVTASYGGVRMRIDRNFVDLGGSRELRRKPARCGRDAGPGYRALNRGDHGRAVRGVQCLLRATGHYRGDLGGGYGRETWRAVRALQRARGLRATGRVDDGTWAALLSSGPRPVLKRGSEGPHVRRLQRALTAALPGSVAVHGHFGPGTTQAVRRYQRRVDLRTTGVAGPSTWRALRAGELVDRSRPDRDKKGQAGKRGKASKHGKNGKHDKDRKHRGKHGKHGEKHGKPDRDGTGHHGKSRKHR